ncbi:helix-turn-helix domain-containing protein [Arachnia propionica]|uniref:XRE family transcriptional regulator n=1 Tax=Arachnia propionica TaxID=1750 RepID=A0A3P1WNS1_9ACTN|nr:XRE family transcriptional regulator [Arachnia propionica]RRD47586.1 XRE family transcriptional regulator [Arachnia propionica]
MLDELRHVGSRLRALRHDRGWTLEQLAAKAQMSPSTLSRLESGKRQVSLDVLLPLVRILGVGVDDLIAPAPVDPRVRRPLIRRDGAVIVPLTRESSPIATYRITYPPGERALNPCVHDGFEWLYVLSGRLRLLLDNRELVLTRGEAAEFNTSIPHAMCAAGRRPAQVISIFNTEGILMHTHTAP